MKLAKRWAFCALLALAMNAGATESEPGAAEAEGRSTEPVQAVWKPQRFVFYYQSFTTFYSCDSLEGKLEQILAQLGARADVRVRAADCGRGPVQMPRAEIELISPVEATPEALAELKKGAATRELAARVSGDRARAVELAEQFPAQWKRVTIGRGRGAPVLESGDCELLDQVHRKIIPRLAVKVIEVDTPCPPNAPSVTRPSIVVEALTEMPKPDEAPGN